MIEAVVLEGTPHASLPATTAAHAALQPMDAPITTHAVTLPDIVAPNPKLTTSPRDVTHTSIQTGASLTPATPTAQHRNFIQKSKTTPKTLYCPINSTI